MDLGKLRSRIVKEDDNCKGNGLNLVYWNWYVHTFITPEIHSRQFLNLPRKVPEITIQNNLPSFFPLLFIWIYKIDNNPPTDSIANTAVLQDTWDRLTTSKDKTQSFNKSKTPQHSVPILFVVFTPSFFAHGWPRSSHPKLLTSSSTKSIQEHVRVSQCIESRERVALNRTPWLGANYISTHISPGLD